MASAAVSLLPSHCLTAFVSSSSSIDLLLQNPRPRICWQLCSMATEKSTSAPSSSIKQYYVAVGTYDSKLATLMELLTALQGHQPVHAAICCSSRDSLDEVVCALRDSHLFSICVLHSDMTDKEREFQVSNLKKAMGTARPDAAAAASPIEAGASTLQSGQDTGRAGGPAGEHPSTSGQELRSSMTDANQITSTFDAAPWGAEPSSLVLVATDVCLKAAPKELLPLGMSLLVQYDLPYKKEVYARRVAMAFGSGKERRGHRNIIIDFIVAGEVAQFRNAEKFTSAVIQEMPVHVTDVFTA